MALLKHKTKIFYKKEMLEELDYPPVNLSLYNFYKKHGCEYIISEISHSLTDHTVEIKVLTPDEFKKDFKKEHVKLEERKVPKKYETVIENKERFVIQKRERLKELKGKWSNWSNFKEFEVESERDEDLKMYLKEQTLNKQFRPYDKFKRGVNLSEDQKLEKNKGEGNFQILFKEFDKNTKKISGVKIYQRFKTPEERQEFFDKMTKEEKNGKIFKFKTSSK